MQKATSLWMSLQATGQLSSPGNSWQGTLFSPAVSVPGVLEVAPMVFRVHPHPQPRGSLGLPPPGLQG